MDDDLSEIVSLLLGLLSHRNRMTLMRALAVGIRLVVRRRRVRAVLAVLDPVVPLLLDLVHLAVLEVRARAEHPRDADEREEEEEDLDEGLARVELVVRGNLRATESASRNPTALAHTCAARCERGRRRTTHITGAEEHLDEHVEEVGRVAAGGLPVDRPFVDDADDEVAKDRLHEEDLREELGPDQLGAPKVQVVEDLEADGERHLRGRDLHTSAARRGNDTERRWDGTRDSRAGRRARSTSSF